MSLDWSISEVKDFKERCWVAGTKDPEKKRLHYVTEALIWGTMSVDLGSITEKNVDKWAERLHILGQLGEYLMYDTVEGKQVERNPTMEELRNHIGLSTNVSTLADTKWKTRIWREMVRKAQRSVKDGD